MTRGTPIPETVTLHVPFRIVKRGGRKEMQMPDGAAPAAQDRQHAGQGAGPRLPLEADAGVRASSPPSPNWPSARGSRPPT